VAEQPGLSFAGLLRQLRAEARLTQEELAEAAGVSPGSVSNLERGINRTAHKDTAVLLAGALGLAGPAGELFVAAARGKAPAADVLVAARDGAAPRPMGVTGSPYRGLTAFEEQDAGFFFGRETAAIEVLDRMSRSLGGAGLLVVSGVSGAGKSSLLRAGVLPRLRADGLPAVPEAAWWPRVVFTPTRAPLDELALRAGVLAGADAAAVRRELEGAPAWFALTARQAALARPPGDQDGSPAMHDRPGQRRLVLVVDQFEELFTQCPEEGQRRAFITALHAAATAGHGPDQAPAALVVLGVRADFEARCADYPQLAGPVQDRYLVTAMTERQLRMAITEPAKKAGAKVDDDLADRLLAEVRTGQPGAFGAGALPLLSHALDQAWRHRTGEAVTLADYERAGGIEGAVAATAQRAYDRLSPPRQAAARQVFLRLTATSPDGTDTADRAARAELTEGRSPAEAEDVAAVLEAFAAERLLTLAADTVELSHEVLLTAWPLLRDTWLADTHADRIVRTRLHTTAADWERHARDPSYLYTGTLLAAATETATRIGADPARHPPLSQTERDFLHASNHAAVRSSRQRRMLAGALVVLLIAAVAGAAIAAAAARNASQQRTIAVSGQLAGESEALDAGDPVTASRLAAAAWRIAPTAQARDSMLDALAQPDHGVLPADTGAFFPVTLVFSPDGKTLATMGGNGGARLWDLATNTQIGTPLGRSVATAAAFSPDSKTLATVGDSGARLWDLATHTQIGTPLGSGEASAVAFSPDGKTLATVSNNSNVRLWDVATHAQIGASFTIGPPSTPNQPWPPTVAFSPDGKTLATVSYDGKARLWDVTTHNQIGPPFGDGLLPRVAFSPDGKTLATVGGDGKARVWDVTTHTQSGASLTTGPASTPDQLLQSMVAFSPDGRTLATVGNDGIALLWDLATHTQIDALPALGVTTVAFSPDGKTLATGDLDGTARLWDLVAVTGLPVNIDVARADRLNPQPVAFSPNGKTLATVGNDGTARLWDVATRTQIGAPFGSGVDTVAFSPDSKTLATVGNDGIAQLWDIATHNPIGPPFGSDVDTVAFSPNGKTLATVGNDGIALLWDIATLIPIGPPFGSGGGMVAISLNGKTLATVGNDGKVHQRDAATNAQIGAPFGSDVDTMAFSPDGKTLATIGSDLTARLWDIATHAQIGAPFGSGVGAVAFSPDRKTLATAGNGTAQLWDLATHAQIGPSLGTKVSAVAFSPDGKTLATAGPDGTQLWPISPEISPTNLLDAVCAIAGGSLTRQEWSTYIPSEPFQPVCP